MRELQSRQIGSEQFPNTAYRTAFPPSGWWTVISTKSNGLAIASGRPEAPWQTAPPVPGLSGHQLNVLLIGSRTPLKIPFPRKRANSRLAFWGSISRSVGFDPPVLGTASFVHEIPSLSDW